MSFYKVSNGNGSVCEYFNSRESAINFIVDEFAMALAFRTDTEGEHLTKYMQTHNETPNQYPYKYKIEEIGVNHEYDKPNDNSVYLVKVDSIHSCMQNGDEHLFSDYASAREFYDDIVDEDIKHYGNHPKAMSDIGTHTYDRWFDNENYCVEHLKVELIEFIPNKDGSNFSKKCILLN